MLPKVTTKFRGIFHVLHVVNARKHYHTFNIHQEMENVSFYLWFTKIRCHLYLALAPVADSGHNEELFG